jgi:hypothetical protein
VGLNLPYGIRKKPQKVSRHERHLTQLLSRQIAGDPVEMDG